MFSKGALVTLTLLFTSTFGHPLGGLHHRHAHQHHHSKRAVGRGLDTLASGNQRFLQKIATSEDPNLLKTLADEGQEPPFMFLGCSDSRVNDGTIFDASPGTFFTERNIANQYSQTDINAQAILAYGLTELGVEHVVVMGHYGCGGIGASIASAPTGGVDAAGLSIQSWIAPLRAIWDASTRPEIVAFKEAHGNETAVEEPEIDDPAFRALVEENVKATVKSISADPIIVNIFSKLAETPASNETITPAERKLRRRSGEEVPLRNIFVHGLVYDISTGEITDLGISVGPPGVEIPTFASVSGTPTTEGANPATPAGEGAAAVPTNSVEVLAPLTGIFRKPFESLRRRWASN